MAVSKRVCVISKVCANSSHVTDEWALQFIEYDRFTYPSQFADEAVEPRETFRTKCPRISSKANSHSSLSIFCTPSFHLKIDTQVDDLYTEATLKEAK